MPAIDLTLDFWQCATEAASVAALVSTLPPPPSLPSQHQANGTSAATEHDTAHSPPPPSGLGSRRRSVLGAPPPAPSSNASSASNVPIVSLRRRSSVAIDHAADAIPKVVRRHSRGSLIPPGIGGPIAGVGGPRPPKRPPTERDPVVVQADTIMADIIALASYLHHIRRAYLGTVAPLPSGAFATTASSIPLTVMGVELPMFDHNLGAAERDQIDQLVAMVLGQANARIKQLSALIDRERQLLESDKSSTSGFLSRLMGGAAPVPPTSDEEHDDSADPKHLHAQAMLTHYSSMVWVLNQHMFRVTNEHRRLHERRVERDLGRLALDTSATNTPSTLAPDARSSIRRRPVATTSGSSYLAAASASIGLPTASTSSSASAASTSIPTTSSTSTTAPAQMIQEFEAENKELLEMFESKLDEVKTAETSLLTIAQLQTELAQHMAVQQSQIESLVDDAVVHVANVRAGNVELTKAREYGKTARFWFLFIMLVVSATLLFLDWYAG
ncbi:hypothetical protein BCR44DRAFT_1500692 [Catenaria anguillulae PL171]|uniref:t-SNARE coiled-coil homology domain-containing protein n=1 Tax=Catenaria anguillulae PL171 TaxID=765915 RepID=A0A1Y2HIA3_9FUNG|nr:hypothetical protein BCR44DRAFT_1500692 [Catenaria anguillulae PL171]